MVGKTILVLLVIGVVGTGCTVDDADRCLEDYVWSESQLACIHKDDVDTATDNMDTAGVTDTETNGVGVACASDTDCSMHQASVCLANPSSPDVGMCTLYGCVSADCGEPFDCCDCTSMTSDFFRTDLPFCVPVQNTEVLETSFECNCD